MSEKNRKTFLIQTLPVIIGLVIVPAAVIGVFAMLNRFHWNVVTGSILGASIAFVNQLLLVVSVGKVFDKATKERGNEEMTEEQIAEFTARQKKKLNLAMKASYVARFTLLIAAVLCAVLLKNVFNIIAFVVSIVAEQLLITFSGVLSKKTAR